MSLGDNVLLLASIPSSAEGIDPVVVASVAYEHIIGRRGDGSELTDSRTLRFRIGERTIEPNVRLLRAD